MLYLKDPLHVVPLLLEVDNSAAGDILNLVAENGNPKENIIASQEGLERHIHRLVSEEVEPDKTFLPLQRLLLLYNSCTSLKCFVTSSLTCSTLAAPRVKLLRRSPTDTVKPFLRNLSTAVELAASSLSSKESCQIMTYICKLLSNLQNWAAAWENGSDVSGYKASAP